MEADLVSILQPRVKSRLRADPADASGDIHSVALVVPSAAGSGLFVGFRVALDASPWLGGQPWHSASGRSFEGSPGATRWQMLLAVPIIFLAKGLRIN